VADGKRLLHQLLGTGAGLGGLLEGLDQGSGVLFRPGGLQRALDLLAEGSNPLRVEFGRHVQVGASASGIAQFRGGQSTSSVGGGDIRLLGQGAGELLAGCFKVAQR
jgi:hypothetical protein